MENELQNHEADWLVALSQAADLFDERGDARVPAIFHSLRVAIHRMKLAGANHKQLKPLVALLDDLDRLNHRQPLNVLKPRDGFSAIWPDRHHGAFVAQQAIAIVVQDMTFRQLGSKRVRRKAETQAAILLRKYGYKSHMGKPITENMLRQWRSKATDRGEEFAHLRDCLEKLRSWSAEHLGSANDEAAVEKLLLQFADHPSLELS